MLTFSRRAAFATVLTLAGLSAAYGDEVKYTAKLDAASETPANDSKGMGMVDAHFDTATKMLTWTVTYSGLTGPATAGAFPWPRAGGQGAGVMVPIKSELGSPIKGSATLTDDQAKALTDGMMYFNVHTEANKAGEIRGQLLMGM